MKAFSLQLFGKKNYFDLSSIVWDFSAFIYKTHSFSSKECDQTHPATVCQFCLVSPLVIFSINMDLIFSDANNVKQQLADKFATGAVITPSVSMIFFFPLSSGQK